ncbi:BTB/POZ domain-containing protein At3g56230 [Morus notabilis]|uniref:BTB/POZ domain-containing protein At3g56230 n=1 Tax=Morus notabilis TaxID=981085 RepID=UPI000CED6948|nr:BTB/POZ domain-containing protein At3g56230 [Morus notabilis]
MDCVICASVPHIFRPPRNTICGTCYEGARKILNTLEEQMKENDNTNLHQSLMNVWRRLSAITDAIDDQNERTKFLSTGPALALKEQIHPDIFVKPGSNGPSIPAHKAILAIRSEVLKNMLDSDSCKAPANDTITLSELSYEELKSLLEFLYSGSLPEEKMKKHVYALSLAADKYNIPYLQKMCERHMLDSLSLSNALKILEVSDVCSFRRLKETVLKFVGKNMREIIFSPAYDAFALKNPHLGVEITRALLNKDAKNAGDRFLEEAENSDAE